MRRKVQVLFSYNNGPVSRLIRAFTREQYSHVAIKYGDNQVLDARFPGGVKKRPLDYEPQSSVWMDLDMEKAVDCIGSRYDLRKFFWYAFRVGKPWNASSQFLCTEVIAFAAGLKFLEDMTPDQLYMYAKNKEKSLLIDS